MQHDKQQHAHDLYFSTSCTQQQIADILDVSRKTVNLWVKKNRWDEMKAAARQMPSLILQNIYNHITAVNDKIARRDEQDRCPTMQEVEKLRKLLTMTKNIQKQHTGSYMEAFQELQYFIFARDHDLYKKLNGHIQAYLRGHIGDKEFMLRRQRNETVLDITATLAKQEQREAESSDVTSCNADVTTQHISDQANPLNHANQGPSPLAQDNPAGHTTISGNESNPDVTFCNIADPPTISKTEESTRAFSEFLNSDPDVSGTCNMELAEGKTSSTEDGATYFQQAMSLPPHMRPSPFIDGDTVWILHTDHLESTYDTYGNKWGPMKMGYTVRYYPDIEPSKAA